MAATPLPSAPLPSAPAARSVPWADIVAGIALAGLLLPEAVAYSSIANLPPQAGVIALFAGLICYGLIGRSRYAIVSATSSSAAVLAAATASTAGASLSLRLAMAVGLVMLSGVFFLIAGLARIGSVSDFIAKPVLRGFSFGLAIVIILKQLAAMAGVSPRHGDVPRFVAELCADPAAWNWSALAVCGGALLLLLLLGRLPYLRRLPAALVVIGLGIAAVRWGGGWLDLPRHGIALVGAIDLKLDAPALPTLSYSVWLNAVELALAMLMIVYAESYGSIRGFALKHGDATAPNRDLLALGAANLLSGLFHGMPVGAGYSATSANEAAGAVSRLAGALAALALLVIVLTLLPAVALTPLPVLAAVVIDAVGHTLKPAVFRPYFLWRRDRLVVCAAIAAVLIFGVLDGLLAAVAVSLLMLLRRMAESSVTVLGRLDGGHDFVSRRSHPQAVVDAGLLIVRPDTALFFANAERILAQVRSHMDAAGAGLQTVILSLEESPDLDSSSVEALADFCGAVFGQRKRLLLARLKTPVQHVLARAAIPGLTAGTLCDLSVDDAVALARTAHAF